MSTSLPSTDPRLAQIAAAFAQWRLRRMKAPERGEAEALVQSLSERVGRHLERQGPGRAGDLAPVGAKDAKRRSRERV